MRIKLIVFDFDGTLVDTKKMLLSIIRTHVDDFNYRLSKKFIKEFGDQSLGRALEILGIEENVLPYLVDRIEFNFLDHIHHVIPAPHLKSLHDLKKKKVILSNSLGAFISASLKRVHADFFNGIYGSEGATDKYSSFKKILKKYDLKPNQVVYIGDRPIDALLAHRIGCVSVLVANSISWSNVSNITAAEPDFIIHDLSQLKKIINFLDLGH